MFSVVVKLLAIVMDERHVDDDFRVLRAAAEISCGFLLPVYGQPYFSTWRGSTCSLFVTNDTITYQLYG